MSKIGLGGGCHWCTEGIFLSLKGVKKVEQGWISPKKDLNNWSEAVVVYFDHSLVSETDLIEIHLHTHASTSDHSKRNKYRSSIYVFDEEQGLRAQESIANLQLDFPEKIITQISSFGAFKENEETYRNYFFKNPQKPFCQRYILPKLNLINEKFNHKLDPEKAIQY